LETGQVELAQFIYNRAMQIVVAAKADPNMHANLGRVYWEQGLKSAATDEFNAALQIDPNLVLARLYIAEMAIDNRDYETVVSTLEPTLAIAGNDPAIHVNLGIGYRGTGRLEDAKKSYEKALDLDPSDPSPYLNLAVLMGDHFKEYDQAIGLLDTYQRQGGGEAGKVDTWRTDFEKQKRRLDVEAKRKKRRDDAARRRKDAEAAERRIQEEKDRKASEEQAAGAAQPPAEETQPPAAAEEPAPAEPVPTEPPVEKPDPVPETAPAAPPAAAVAGTDCAVVGSCGGGYECANDGVCREAGTPGTFSAGIGCFQDVDCAYGLVCASSQCAAPAGASSSDNPWGN
jgi:hypothetical protein